MQDSKKDNLMAAAAFPSQLLSWKVLTVALFSLYVCKRVYSYYVQEKRITALGAHAPKVRSSLPLGIDIIYKAVRHHVNHEDPNFWSFLLKHGEATGSRTVEANMGGQRVIFTADLENIKALLATQFQDYGKGHSFRQTWHPILGDSVFSLDGEGWHSARQLIRPQFLRNRISDLQIFDRYTQPLLRGLAGGNEAIVQPDRVWKGIGKAVNVSSLIHRFTLDTGTEFLFGQSVGSLENVEEDFAKAFEEAQRVMSLLSRAG